MPEKHGRLFPSAPISAQKGFFMNQSPVFSFSSALKPPYPKGRTTHRLSRTAELRRIGAALLCFPLFFGLLFSSCHMQPRSQNPLWGLQGRFSAGFILKTDKITASGRLEAESPSENERVFSLTFTSPETIAGLFIRAESNGRLRLKLGSVDDFLPDGAAPPFLDALAQVLFLKEPIDRVESCQKDGIRVTAVTVDPCRVFIHPKTQAPIAITRTDTPCEITLTDFTPTQAGAPLPPNGTVER